MDIAHRALGLYGAIDNPAPQMHGVADSAIVSLLGPTGSIGDGIASESRALILLLVLDISGRELVHANDASVAGPSPGAIRNSLPILEPQSAGTQCTTPWPCAVPDIPVSRRLTYAVRHDGSFFFPPTAHEEFPVKSGPPISISARQTGWPRSPAVDEEPAAQP